MNWEKIINNASIAYLLSLIIILLFSILVVLVNKKGNK
jgi:hypothetical protein